MDSLTKKVKSNFRNKIKGGRATSSSSKKDKTLQEQLQSQIDNYETRLQNIGVDPKGATDNRNVVEKALNLKQDQNVIFDIFELINRPQQALFGGINNAIKGKDFVKGLKEGITGEKETSGGDILRSLGMEGSGKGNLFTKEGRKELSLSDFLGFGLDLFADPMDYILAPVKVTSAAGKAVRTADNVADTLSKGTKLVRTADTVGDTARGISKATTALNTLGDVGKTSEVVWKPASSALFSYAGQGIKKGAKLGDNIVEKILGKSDARNLAKLEKRIAQTGETIEDAAKAMNISTSKLDAYKDIKKQLSLSKNSSKNLMGLTNKAREAGNIEDVMSKQGKKIVDSFDNDIKNIVNKTAKNADEAKSMYKKISDALMVNLEKDYDFSIKGQDVIDTLKKGKRTDFFNDESAKAISDTLKEYGIKSSTDGRYITLLDDTKKLKNLTNEFKDKVFGEYLSKEDLLDRQTAESLLNSSPELQELANKSKSAYTDFAAKYDVLSGLNTSDITKAGYGKHGLTEEAKALKQAQGSYPTTNKAFKGRSFKGTTAEYNRIKKATLGESADTLVDDVVNTGSKTTKRGKKAAESIYKTDDAGNFLRNTYGELIRNDSLHNELVTKQKNKIDKFNKQLESAEELFKGRQQGLSAIDESKLTLKDKKNLEIIKSEEPLRESVNELKKIKYENIPPEASDTIDNLSSDLSNFKKARNEYVNGLKKKNITDDELKVLKDNMNKQHEILKTNIKATQELTNKQARQAVKNANKAFKEGKSIGIALDKEMQKLARAQAQTNEIYQAASDLANSLPGQIKYEQAALNKLEDSADAIFKSKSKLIEQEAKAANILMSQEGIEFMNTGFMENFTDYINKSPEFNKGAQIYNEALATGIFNNNNYVKFAEDIGDKVPIGFVKVDGNLLARNLDTYKGIIPKDSKAILNLADNFKGKTLYMDQELARLVKLWSPNNTNSGVRSLLNLWDGINNVFKKFSTLTLGFQERNIIGNSTNMVLSGVSAKELPGYYSKAGDILNKSDDLLKKAADDTLTAAEKTQWDSLQEFYKAGFLDAFEKGQGLESVKNSKGVVGKLSKGSVELNNKVDSYNRLALFLYAKDHPQYVKKLGRNNAVDAVKMVLFDPSNTSDLERNFLKRVIPFYTFTKQNLMFQAENMMRNTPRYNKLFKSLNKAYGAVGKDSYSQYQKENMQIPLPFTGSDGNQLFLKANLPVSDLGEFLSKPLQRTASSASPLIKTPYELVSGKSTFTGEDANYNVLSNLAAKSLNKLGVRSQGIENTAQAAEAILNGFGLQNVSTNLIRKVQAVLDRDNDNISDQQLWAEIFRSVLQNTKQENVINSGLFDQLEQYQAIVKRLKNQGVDVPTMTQINQVNKMKLNRMKNKRARSR